MKKILMAIILLVSSLVHADNSSTVMVDTNGLLLYPSNFFMTNGITTTGNLQTVSDRVTALEVVVPSTSNSFNSRINAATNDIKVLQTNVAVISTNYAPLAMGILGTNAYYRIGVLETNQSFPQGINTTNTITALNFVGSGAGLTGVTASITGGVNRITVGSSNMTGNLTLTGPGVEITGNATTKISQIEYYSYNIAPIITSYELTWLPVFDEDCTLLKVTAKVDNYNVTFDVVTETTNAAWRTYTINSDPIVAVAQGISVSSFYNATIPSNTMCGVRVTDLDPRSTNLLVTFKIKR